MDFTLPFTAALSPWLDTDSLMDGSNFSDHATDTNSSNSLDSSDRSCDGSSRKSTPSSEDEQAKPHPPIKRTGPRKGHTKSRYGCFRCKMKKIKCQETRPMCGNCERTGALCEYPDSMVRARPQPPLLQPQSTPTIFSMIDMRLFHHFIMSAYPHLPVGADKTWTLDIPAFAHEVRCRLQLLLYLLI
jgi:hypothetical protein